MSGKNQVRVLSDSKVCEGSLCRDEKWTAQDEPPDPSRSAPIVIVREASSRMLIIICEPSIDIAASTKLTGTLRTPG